MCFHWWWGGLLQKDWEGMRGKDSGGDGRFWKTEVYDLEGGEPDLGNQSKDVSGVRKGREEGRGDRYPPPFFFSFNLRTSLYS